MGSNFEDDSYNCNSHREKQEQLAAAIRLLHKLNRKVSRIMASQAEEAAKLQAFGDQLDKATAEIVAAIQGLRDALADAGNTTPEVNAATDRLATAAQALDDIVPDVP
jgi:DNA repair exonuclease SbcCD ATPase subunit